MNKFSDSSLKKLYTCDENLQKLMNAAIIDSPIDFGISYGQRTPEEQYALYQQGRTKPGRIVTYKDGYKELSKHNYNPSKAIDIVCYQNLKVTWDTEYYKRVAVHVAKVALELGIKYTWGGEFRTLKDLPHYEVD
jgi:peptidoglycan L-alanyl-D-glutamate endopeptidase CwlK